MNAPALESTEPAAPEQPELNATETSTEPKLTVEDGYVINEETGEIVDRVDAPKFAVTNLEELTWALGKAREAEFAVSNLNMHYHGEMKALLDQIEAIPEVKTIRDQMVDMEERLKKLLRPHGRTIAFFNRHISTGGREVALMELAKQKGKRKTLDTLNGSISSRTSQGSVKVADMPGAVTFAKACDKGALVEQSVKASAIKGLVLEKLERRDELVAKRDVPVGLNEAERARLEYLGAKLLPEAEQMTEEEAKEYGALDLRNLHPEPEGLTAREVTELQWIEEKLAAFEIEPPTEQMYVDVGGQVAKITAA